jgi:hypothetical protein
VRGWINYYGRFYRSRLIDTVLRQINEYLIRWAMRKYKRVASQSPQSSQTLGEDREIGPGPVRPLAAGATRKDWGNGSRMS